MEGSAANVTHLVVIGAGNPGVLKLLFGMPWMKLLGFVDDDVAKLGTQFFGHPILGTREYLREGLPPAAKLFNNVYGSMKSRQAVHAMLVEYGVAERLISLVDATVNTSLCTLGTGVMVEQNVSLDAFVVIGSHCAVKRSASIGHESTLEDFCFVGPGATVCGRVMVKKGTYIGAGSVVRDGVRIGERCVVGAGAVVVKDLEDGVVVVGNPAKALHK